MVVSRAALLRAWPGARTSAQLGVAIATATVPKESANSTVFVLVSMNHLLLTSQQEAKCLVAVKRGCCRDRQSIIPDDLNSPFSPHGRSHRNSQTASVEDPGTVTRRHS